MKNRTLGTIEHILSEHCYYKKIKGSPANYLTQIIEMRQETIGQNTGKIIEKPVAKLKIEFVFDKEDTTAKIFVFNSHQNNYIAGGCWAELFEVPNPASAKIDFWIETKVKGGFTFQQLTDEEQLTNEQNDLITQDWIYLIEAAKDILIWN